MSHHPVLYWAGRHGSWSFCTCGWASKYLYRTVVGAHYAFGLHLLGRPENPLLTRGRRWPAKGH